MTERFEDMFSLESAGADAFTTVLEGWKGRTFGGVVLACLALAASRTCPDRGLHSLYTTFLRPVPPDTPIRLRVERLSEGRRLARRRVQVLVEDAILCECAASFAAEADGTDLQDDVMDDVPPPDDLPAEEEVVRAQGWTWRGENPVEWRWLGEPWRTGERAAYRAWVRLRRPLPDDPGLRASALAYLSDLHSHWPVARRTGNYEPWGYVSLDQAVWQHRDLPWDDWRLLVSEADVAHGGRALTRRTLYHRDGRLLASMVQEALIPGP